MLHLRRVRVSEPFYCIFYNIFSANNLHLVKFMITGKFIDLISLDLRTNVTRIDDTANCTPCEFYPFLDMPLYIAKRAGRLYRNSSAIMDTETRKIAVYEGYAGKQCPKGYIPVRHSNPELKIILAEDVSTVHFKTFGDAEYKIVGDRLVYKLAVSAKDIIGCISRNNKPLTETNYEKIKTSACTYPLIRILEAVEADYCLTSEYLYISHDVIMALEGEVFEFGYIEGGILKRFIWTDCNPYNSYREAVNISGGLAKSVAPLAFFDIKDSCEKLYGLLKTEEVSDADIESVKQIEQRWKQYLKALQLLGIEPFNFFFSNHGVLPRVYRITRSLKTILGGFTGTVRVCGGNKFSDKSIYPDWDNIISIDTHDEDLMLTPDGMLDEECTKYDIKVHKDQVYPSPRGTNWGIHIFIPGEDETSFVKIPWKTEFPISLKDDNGNALELYMRERNPTKDTQYYAKPEDVEAFALYREKFTSLKHVPRFLGVNFRYWEIDDINTLENLLEGRTKKEFIAHAELTLPTTMQLLPRVYGILFTSQPNMVAFLNLLSRRGYLCYHKVKDLEFLKVSDLTEALLFNHLAEYEEIRPNEYQMLRNLLLNIDAATLAQLQHALQGYEITKV